jgi:N-acetyl-anhydromuramyl-L-alanine amidase AmpD
MNRFTAVLMALIALSLPEMTRVGKLEMTERLMDEKFSSPRKSRAVVDMVMVHFSSAVNVHPEDPYRVEDVIKTYEGAPASTHYLIDREGKIYRLVKEERAAWHAGKGKLPWQPDRENAMNGSSIGIEIMAIGSKRDMTKHGLMKASLWEKVRKEHPQFIGYTDAQYEALKKLLADIAQRRPAVKLDRKHVVGHEEYAPERKTDPGELFEWKRLGLKER